MVSKALWVSYCPPTKKQIVNLQWIYGAEGEVQVDTLDCCQVHNWGDIAYAGRECDIVFIDSKTATLLDLPFDELLCDNPKSIIIFSGDSWREIDLRTL